jgi:propanol-preferring alcohol dehydrogenase
MSTMRAVQVVGYHENLEMKELPVPTPTGPFDVVVKIGGAGVCRTDLHILEGQWAEKSQVQLPYTIGHENAGWVHAVGAGVHGVEPGEPVAVYGLNGCGRCKPCAAGAETFCVHGYDGPPGVGFGIDGGMAEYMLVAAHRLVPLGDLDPVAAAPLTDAGLTPYRAIKRLLPKLTPDSAVVVIGAGGLGHLAVQLLNAMCATRVVAVDTRQEALDLAREVGAHETVLSGADAGRAVADALPNGKATAVLDFVGAEATIALGASVIAPAGDLVVVGAAAGTFPWNFYAMPYEASLTTSFWGTLSELHEVIALAQRGLITPHVQRFSLEDGLQAYKLMEQGQLSGRAVIVP